MEIPLAPIPQQPFAPMLQPAPILQQQPLALILQTQTPVAPIPMRGRQSGGEGHRRSGVGIVQIPVAPILQQSLAPILQLPPILQQQPLALTQPLSLILQTVSIPM